MEGWNWPVLQLPQAVPASENLPVMQLVQAALLSLPASADWPAEQLEHAKASPEALLYLPGEQLNRLL